jgi:ParB-like chromosome segregation protein Spo0J
VTGAHRLAAAKVLGWDAIDCVIITDDDVNAELWEIDENLMRAELDAAEHARLTKRRAEIIEATAKVVSQVGTAPKKNPKGGGRADVAGKASASVRDQAEKTGESKTKVARSKKRAEVLGDETLRRVTGTALGTGAQLDALMKLNPEKREDLMKRAEAGEDVSAVRVLAAEAAPSTEPPALRIAGGPTQTDIENALASLDPDEPTLDDDAMGRIAKPKRLPDDAPHENLETGYMVRIDLATNALRGCENIVGGLPKNFPRKMKRNMADAARAAAAAWSALALTLEKSLRSAEGSMQLDGLDRDPTLIDGGTHP